ncbi:MAG: type II toxin-antitoxin system Phd/YefM family antitoxin [Spirochaetales bacterium]|nr:type II toxin-antitoxin system Phd/YefM family antitoxin [Spirochaetales bacterium]
MTGAHVHDFYCVINREIKDKLIGSGLDLVNVMYYSNLMETITTYYAKTHLSSILKKVEAGEEIIIRRGEIPIAKLVPLSASRASERPKVGEITSEKVTYTEDAFEPLSNEEMEKWGFY